MSDGFKHMTVERDARGVATVWLDVQGYPLNVFSDEVLDELGRVVGEFEREMPKVVVFRSRKASGFLAGADVRRIRQIATPDEARMAVDLGRNLFDRVENLTCPTVAVIHGPCLGGGLEFVLACRHRIARDDSSTRLGLPEVQLGLLPGWGGTQRLPRLVGLRTGLRLILESRKLSASEALAVGLVDLTAPPDDFETAVGAFVADRLAGKPLSSRHKGLTARLEETAIGRKAIGWAVRRTIRSRGRDYPALPAALNAVEEGFRSRASGFAAEREAFSRLLFTDTARNLIDLFFQREKAGKAATWVTGGTGDVPAVRKVAVLGGGIMGAGIAQLALVSGYEVVVKEINADLAAAGLKRVTDLTNEAVKKGVLDREVATERLRTVTATSEWAPVEGADLVIEAVIEKEKIKRDVFTELSTRLSPRALLTTNTSSLLVSRVCEPASGPDRVAGLHFFNPVHKMHLVEVVRGPDTSGATIAALVEFVRKLGKVPVVVNDGPGFLVNRILFPYLDEGVRLLLEGYSTETIDKAAVRFGMPMGPLELLDQVGIDVAAHVAKSLGVVAADPSPTPDRLTAMADRGWLGRKADRGFYEYRKGRRSHPTHWDEPAGSSHSHSDDAAAHPTGLTAVQRRLMYPMINEAARCLESATADAPWVIDFAMVLGTGFAPFRGGPLRAADAWGMGQVVSDLEQLSRTHGARFAPCSLLKEMTAEGRTFYAKPASVREQPVPAVSAAGPK
ncbi:3-hydroxyacyl-CoA dehydrogenase NAD-binding domain-containing protein [Fimbriiglobus ruber]|uniref:enoyl-CoA hydratase n=1 Tax=Fimbriiglobus ruber TaxID=1908690 RepID=A0A225EDA7_9BACT|nr:3-hydroxyacyl-CoA dehydrogenase NAD-binding domain-containing protein [Fimbriiglobus ruber]OWK47299.1 multifunctional fatty acid oxidation complex subunit alpha [Fimbriiglobus ruber]